MLQLRMHGTKNEIKWFKKIIYTHPKIDVVNISDFLQKTGTNKYYTVFADVTKKD